MRAGLGDGLVSETSSRLTCGGEHVKFHLNHVEILFHEDVRKKIVEWLIKKGNKA